MSQEISVAAWRKCGSVLLPCNPGKFLTGKENKLLLGKSQIRLLFLFVHVCFTGKKMSGKVPYYVLKGLFLKTKRKQKI